MVSTVAVLPLPLIVPALVVQLATLTGTPSGLVQEHVTDALPPTCRLLGLAEHETVGGFFGGSFTV